ncbi:hypothetical protein CH254_02290 [Rhodococcus sp. 06-412-2C]|uniref:hypothetical protein n=1 Tax=unclassified Rhodococcus (in: high G+C Gram-positive bacteria) TaxID=192944 RepID=UPI000B9A2CB3|nr:MULTISPECIES: hypothetical protein [unclassified Rhodococcus (in: high G+C Gram-positive bacteria)]OZC93477.1 hypothetical protein CH254_02290 [Rhodococcus sp. 06-412-2C]OZC95271.1 hypothetical protein CH279_18690 [Rhodococcus sp. 06-412-2B]
MTTAAAIATAATTLTLHSTADGYEHREFDFSANTPDQYDPFTYLLDFCRNNALSMRHDPESCERVQGWFIERHLDGVQVFAAVIK